MDIAAIDRPRFGPRGVLAAAALITLALAFGVATVADRGVATGSATQSVIIEATDVETAERAAHAAGGTITHRLGIIDAVAADVPVGALESLRRTDGVRGVSPNHAVTTAGKPVKDDGNSIDNAGNAVQDTMVSTLVGADRVHAEGNLGYNATVAVLDTGLWKHDGIVKDPSGAFRLEAVYNAVSDSTEKTRNTDDGYGHGSHVASIAVSSQKTDDGRYNGIAPGATLISIVAFDERGSGTYADVIRGVDWVARNAGTIDVLNLSIGATARSHYWNDPLNRAVMRAWQAGVVVVTSAGNVGPDPMTVTVPGNVPYIVTVGAMTDAFTPEDPTDDRLTSFSATGPTVEGFVKPEIVAPGGHVLGLMDANSTLAQDYPQFYDGGKYFEMSGTSQATAVVSGIVALMRSADPTLSPDDVKCRLIAAARPASSADGTLAYSIFQQGAGRVDAYAAVHGTDVGCANRGLDVDRDLAGTEHYGGPANQAADGTYYLMNDERDGTTWDGTWEGTQGFVFSDAFVFSDVFPFTDAFLFTDGSFDENGMVWTDGFVFSDGYAWTEVFPFTDMYIPDPGDTSGTNSSGGGTNSSSGPSGSDTLYKTIQNFIEDDPFTIRLSEPVVVQGGADRE